METEDLKPVATVWLQIFLSLFPRSKSAVTAVSNLAHSDSPWNADASSEMNQAPIAASLSSDLGSLKKKKNSIPSAASGVDCSYCQTEEDSRQSCVSILPSITVFLSSSHLCLPSTIIATENTICLPETSFTGLNKW